MHSCTLTHTHTHSHTHTHTFFHIHAHSHMLTHTHTHSHILTHTNTRKHTQTHTHTLTTFSTHSHIERGSILFVIFHYMKFLSYKPKKKRKKYILITILLLCLQHSLPGIVKMLRIPNGAVVITLEVHCLRRFLLQTLQCMVVLQLLSV